MKSENTSVGDANVGNAHEHEQCCMSDEQAKIALAIIKQPDQRFASIGENEQSIAQGIAMYNLIKESSEKGVSGFSNHFIAHVRVVKKHALQDQTRKRTFKRPNKKTGEIEFVQRTVTCDAGTKNEDGVPTMLETFVANSNTCAETIEEAERQHEMQEFLSKVKAKVNDLPVDGRSKRAFALYVIGYTYESIAHIVYGYSYGHSNPETKKIYSNKVSAAIHSIFVKLRTVYGDEAKMVLRPVRHVYERYA